MRDRGCRVASLLAMTVGVLLLLGAALPRAFAGAAPTPAFQQTACTGIHLSPDIAPRVRCGTVSVPRDYANPGRGSFNLAVVVVSPAHQPALPDPVVYISGGPGSPLTIYTDYQAHHPYAADRNLILVDQRGVGRSQPDLCPGMAGALLSADIAALQTPTAAALAHRRTVYLACRGNARAQGIDLDDFGTATTAEDFEQVRQALGIAQWNVFGESYGTSVAMMLMARHPATIRSVALDSIDPPDPRPTMSVAVAEARTAFFALCQHDATCGAAYPDLAATYQQTMQRLAGAPLTIDVPPQLQQPDNRAKLTASEFEYVVGQLLFYANDYPSLPHLIATVHDGDTADITKALALVLAGARELNLPVHVAVDCRDRPHERAVATAAPDASANSTTEVHVICGEWSDLGPPLLIPTGINIPTLVLTGQFDPNISPSLSRHIAEQIGAHAQWVEFPLLGHNVRHFSPCAAGIVAAFIARPEQSPDTSCAPRRPPIRFLPR